MDKADWARVGLNGGGVGWVGEVGLDEVEAKN